MAKTDPDREGQVIVQQRDGDTWETVETFTGPKMISEATEEAKSRADLYGGKFRVQQVTTLDVYVGGKGKVSSIGEALVLYTWPNRGPSKDVAVAAAQHQADRYGREHYVVASRLDPTEYSIVINGWGDYPWHLRVDPKRR